VTSTANSLDEMLLKIRIVGWAVGARYGRLEQLDHWHTDRLQFIQGEEYEALVSLREDIRNLAIFGLTYMGWSKHPSPGSPRARIGFDKRSSRRRT
jgi:hypothetical protein